MLFQTPNGQFVNPQATQQADAAHAKAAAEGKTVQALYQSVDGGWIIDNPVLARLISIDDYVPDQEILARTHRWVPNVVNANGTVGGWVPLNKFHDYSEFRETEVPA